MRMPTRAHISMEALTRRFSAAPTFEHLDAWIVSPGGVATTSILEHVRQFVVSNDAHDVDDLKHWPAPPKRRLATAKTRVVFVYGDPSSIVASLARRHWTMTQAVKLGSVHGAILTGGAGEKALRRAVERQIAAWRDPVIPAVLSIEYDWIWDHVDAIARHFGIEDKAFVTRFPKRHTRASSPS